jgi:hypothetical protein
MRCSVSIKCTTKQIERYLTYCLVVAAYVLVQDTLCKLESLRCETLLATKRKFLKEVALSSINQRAVEKLLVHVAT